MSRIAGITVEREFKLLYDSYTQSSKGLDLLKLTGIAPNQLDIGNSSKEFFQNRLSDVYQDQNSNITEIQDPTTYSAHLMNGPMKLLGYHTLWYYGVKRYGIDQANRDIAAIWDGELYFHDAHGKKLQLPYCYAFSLTSMVVEGRPYGPSINTPAKHRRSFISQVDKLIGDMSRQFAGATAPSDFFMWYAHFCQKENLDPRNPAHRKEIIQDYQSLVVLFNDASRSEGESPFVNLGIYDESGLNSLFGHVFYPDGSKPDIDYIMELQKIFCEWFKNGDPITGFPYRFPVVTMNITIGDKKEFIDEEFAQWAAETNMNLGNFNIHFGKKSKLAMCCRYENDLDDMDMSPDSFGNGGVNIGSHRVVTINLPRLALDSNAGQGSIEELLTHRMDTARRLLKIHRIDVLQKRIDRTPKYLKFFGDREGGGTGWFSLDTMFSTFGITGAKEMVEYLGYDIIDDNGTEIAQDIFSFMREKTKEYRKEDGWAYNIEEIPGEQTCVTLVKKDRTFGYDIATNLYSNQYVPLIADVDIFDRIDIAGRFMSIISGGGIVHLNFEDRLHSAKMMYQLFKLCAQSGVNHVGICFRTGKCINGHTNIIGQSRECPDCGAPIKTAMNRVIGYYSFEECWNPTRRNYDAELRVCKDWHEEE